MIPVAFDYVRASTVEEAVAALGAAEEGKVLAGGQSLLPVLRLRLAAPTVLVDLAGVAQLRGVHLREGALVIGAMTTHAEVAASDLVREHAPLLALAAGTVGDRQVRHRGTLGGSLAHADPAADLPAVAAALDATYVVQGPAGRRSIGAADFAIGLFTTALAPDEVLVEVRLPSTAGWAVHYEKFHRTSQSWAIVGVAAAVRRDNGGIGAARIALTNVGPVPHRARTVEEALTGAPATPTAIAEACGPAAAGTAPVDDLSASADYRRELARVLTTRAVCKALGV
ncbi:xanthine dehydrogenase family protein subunit M [Dactylosporangium vinaceum]|uniref:FAD binding domain-containing protein n=1 Tax=Dactylosporangium vinaceum TaxID=53362 RepID=A0ABV5MBR4_9ACTN|nr:xanthine dehydrogenase family protein subunit M [Dactylosporangium vinaceum]UAB98514.1 xanthine dehydrogenase family protein subunit M [Dactylosporangium vinaceum]